MNARPTIRPTIYQPDLMFTGNFKKIVLILFVNQFQVVNLSISTMLESLERNLREKSKQFNDFFPGERLYLHLDRFNYAPGENVWFQAYLRNDADFTASTVSNILYAEIVGLQGETLQKISLIASGGLAEGDLQLPTNLSGGVYTIRGYTEWQLNDPTPALFEQPIVVQSPVDRPLRINVEFDQQIYHGGDLVTVKYQTHWTENEALNAKLSYRVAALNETLAEGEASFGSNYLTFPLPTDLKTGDYKLIFTLTANKLKEELRFKTPVNLTKYKVDFFPEGGDLVAGLESNVAFFVTDENGNPITAEGVLIKNSTDEIVKLYSNENGLGSFKLTPEYNVKYNVRFEAPEQKFKFPNVLQRGYVLKARMETKRALTVTVGSTDEREVLVVGQMRGVVYLIKELKCGQGENIFKFDTGALPAGVFELTLLDINGVERCERLVFVNADKVLKVKISTPNAEYHPREQVQLTVEAKDWDDNPIIGDFSISVTQSDNQTALDRFTSNLCSWFLFENDLTGRLLEPQKFFNAADPENVKQNTDLDLALMTRHWRRFSWKIVRSDELPKLKHQRERNVIGGRVVFWEPNAPLQDLAPLPETTVLMLGTDKIVKTNEQGYFLFENVGLSAPVTLRFEHKKERFSIVKTVSQTVTGVFDEIFGNDREKRKTLPDVFAEREGITQYTDQLLIILGKPGADELSDEALMKAAELQTANSIANKTQAEPNEELLSKYHRNFVLANLDLPIFPPRSHRPVLPTILDEPESVTQIIVHPNIPIFHRSRIFPSIQRPEIKKTEELPDRRSTIYWQANLKLNDKGVGVTNFYLSDDVGIFNIVAEGISRKGILGAAFTCLQTHLPFHSSLTCPQLAFIGDEFVAEIVLENHTAFELKLEYEFENLTNIFEIIGANPIGEWYAPANQTIKQQVRLKALVAVSDFQLKIALRGSGVNEKPETPITILEGRFQRRTVASAPTLDKEFDLRLPEQPFQNLQIRLDFYRSLQAEIEGIASNLNLTDAPPRLLETAISQHYLMLLRRHFSFQPNPAVQEIVDSTFRFLRFEAEGFKGFSNLPNTPVDTGLTAYVLWYLNNLTLFARMHHISVDPAPLNAISEWLLNQRDGKGNLTKETPLNSSREIVNATILHALVEYGVKNIDLEINVAYNQAIKSKDPYQIAFVALALIGLKDQTRLEAVIKLLLKLQLPDGGWEGASTTFMGGVGIGLKLETTALALLAIIRYHKPNTKALMDGLDFLYANRQPESGFGSSTVSVAVVQAFMLFARSNKKSTERPIENGQIEIQLNGETVAQLPESAQNWVLPENILQEKLNLKERAKLKIKTSGIKTAIPVALSCSFSSENAPKTNEGLILRLEWAQETLNLSETASLNIEIINPTAKNYGLSVVRIGLPAGFSFDQNQFRRWREKDNRLLACELLSQTMPVVRLYLSHIASNDSCVMTLNLKPNFVGVFSSSPASVYPYYSQEQKSWTKTGKITVVE